MANQNNKANHSPFTNKIIVVTGATGYIGSRFVESLGSDPKEIRLISFRQPFRNSAHPNRKYFQKDLADKNSWDGILEGADFVFHFAAYEHNQDSTFDAVSDYRVNCLSTLHLLESLRSLKQQTPIIYTSTSHLAGLQPPIPVNESVVPSPLNLFAVHKLTCEKYLSLYFREFGIPGISLRVPNIFGPAVTYGLSEKVAVNRMIRNAVLENKVTLYGNSACIRDFLFVDELIKAFEKTAVNWQGCAGKFYFLGSGEAVTLETIAHTIVELAASRLGKKVSIVQNLQRELAPMEWRSFAADSSAFTQQTGWTPQCSLRQGLETTLQYFAVTPEKRHSVVAATREVASR